MLEREKWRNSSVLKFSKARDAGRCARQISLQLRLPRIECSSETEAFFEIVMHWVPLLIQLNKKKRLIPTKRRSWEVDAVGSEETKESVKGTGCQKAMTYKSRDRSLTEVLIAVVFVCFFVGFITVLCVGNYYRAKRAMERQRQRRLARLAGNAGNGVVGLRSADSPGSTISGASSANSTEHRNLMGGSSAISQRQNRDKGVDLLLM